MLQVRTVPDELTATAFTFVVPGHQRWTLRSVHATAQRAVGGIPTRAYVLEITNGTTDVALAGADDAGTEPGTCSVTWCLAANSAVAAGADGFSVGSVGNLILEAGYNVIGRIVNGAAGDQWVTPAVWFDFAYTD